MGKISMCVALKDTSFAFCLSEKMGEYKYICFKLYKQHE